MIFISLGSNIGNRLYNLRLAVDLLKGYVNIRKYSIIIETDAVLPENAPYDWNKPYLNMIIDCQTNLAPENLLYILKYIERKMGRSMQYKTWSPRIIDIDILLYNNLVINTVDLVVPHPELKNRHFLMHLLALMQVDPWMSKTDTRCSFINSYVLNPQIVGVVNATTDSFSDGGKFYDVHDAVNQVLLLERSGASIIEIGAQSTRPGAIIQSMELEYQKLDEVLANIMQVIDDKDLKISIDTFHSSNVLRLIQKYKIELVNNVKGNFDDDVLKIIADHECKLCLMHSLTIPPDHDNVLVGTDRALRHIIEWGENLLERLMKLGFDINDVILDPGIGFGKTLYQNIYILNNLKELKKLGCRIMLGHSRKSYISAFSAKTKPGDRDVETIGTSLALIDTIDYLRVHDVEHHMEIMVSYYLFKSNII